MIGRAAATLLAVTLLAVACAPVPPSSGPSASVVPDARTQTSPDPGTPTAPRPTPKHEVYGFVPYWEMDDTIAEHVGKVDLTTLGLFSVTHRRSGELATNQTGYKRISGRIGDAMIRAAHDRGTRVELVYSSFGATKNQRFYTEPEAQARWITELVALAKELGVDGINVDVEGLPLEFVPAYGLFVGRLREALRTEIPKGQVSVATAANERGALMAAAAAAAGADRIFLMGYDYHWAGSDPGASSPLARLDGDPRDLTWSLDLYRELGVPVERTLLGLPLYGMTWPVVGPAVGAPATGRGNDWVPRRNLRVFEDPGFAPTYEPIESVEFYAVPIEGGGGAPSASPSSAGSSSPSDGPAASPEPGWNAVYFDSPRSLTPKLALADARGLAGVGFWAIGYERGLPAYDDLIATFKAGKLKAP